MPLTRAVRLVPGPVRGSRTILPTRRSPLLDGIEQKTAANRLLPLTITSGDTKKKMTMNMMMDTIISVAAATGGLCCVAVRGETLTPC
jgi:hypothetical protein